jgi:hypothetical protein
MSRLYTCKETLATWKPREDRVTSALLQRGQQR